MRAGGRILAFGAAGALGLSGAMAAALPSGAQPLTSTSVVRLAASSPLPVPRGAVRLGALAPGSVLRLDVTLRLPGPAALTAFLAGVSDRRSPLFRHFLRRGQFGPMFGPSLATVAAVRSALKRAGLTPGQATPDRLAIPVTAPAAAVERAFGVSLVRYRLPGGRVAYTSATAPRIPAAVAPFVSGVLGLDDLYLNHPLAVPSPLPARASGRAAARPAPASIARASAAGPVACAAAKNAGVAQSGFTMDILAQHYLMSPLYKLGDLGHGVPVAVFEQEPDSTADVSAYESCFGVHTAVTYTKVDGGAGSGPGSGEAALDIDNIIGLAPGVTIHVYQGPNHTASNVYDIYHAIIAADAEAVISTSWGICEAYVGSLASAEQTLFEEASSQGQTVLAAAGDSGSTGCWRSGGPSARALSAGDPASQPFVIGVGGTVITNSGEFVWNESHAKPNPLGAGGGGLSAVWCMPAYQHQTAIPGVISSRSATAGACPAAQGHFVRQEPDVSADADPLSGYVNRWNGHWVVTGGTSAAAPLWAAVAALTDASPFCTDYQSGFVGVLPQGLYAMVARDHSYVYGSIPEGLGDIRQGNNDYTPSGYTGGLFPATFGYDMASGLGVPLVSGLNSKLSPSIFYPGLAALMCREYATKLLSAKITGISPRLGPLGGGQKVTVTGSGFLPIAGADMVKVGTTMVAAHCTSTTTCTFITPKHAAGTVDIRLSAEDFGFSPITTADRYGYVAAPKITSLSPNHGSPGGGNRVTIRGANFLGVRSVHFGSKLATHITFISAAEIIVTAPSGSGTVKVTVTAAGGTSNPVLYLY